MQGIGDSDIDLDVEMIEGLAKTHRSLKMSACVQEMKENLIMLSPSLAKVRHSRSFPCARLTPHFLRQEIWFSPTDCFCSTRQTQTFFPTRWQLRWNHKHRIPCISSSPPRRKNREISPFVLDDCDLASTIASQTARDVRERKEDEIRGETDTVYRNEARRFSLSSFVVVLDLGRKPTIDALKSLILSKRLTQGGV